MIYLTKGQPLADNASMVVYGSTGYYNDGDSVICAGAGMPEEPVCRYEAKYIKYGPMVYTIADPDALLEQILAMDPESLFGKESKQVAVDRAIEDIVPQSTNDPGPDTSTEDEATTTDDVIDDVTEDDTATSTPEVIDTNTDPIPDTSTTTPDVIDVSVPEPTTSTTTPSTIIEADTSTTTPDIIVPDSSTSTTTSEVLDIPMETSTTTAEVVSFAKKIIKKKIAKKFKA